MRKNTSSKQLNNISDVALDASSISEYKAALIKSRRVIINSMVTTLAMMITLVASTIAWFANNKDIKTSNMSMSVDVGANLVIALTPDELGVNVPSVTFETSSAIILAPAQHFEKGLDSKDENDYPVNLRYNSNPRAVSATSGIKKDGIDAVDLLFNPVPEYSNGDAKRYYVDYEVVVASAGKPIIASSFKAKMMILAEDDSVPDYQNASSLDIYLDGEYAGTMNYAFHRELELSPFDDIIIPSSKDDNIKITIRFYFDGGLMKNSAEAYVRSSELRIEGYKLAISFEALDKVS